MNVEVAAVPLITIWVAPWVVVTVDDSSVSKVNRRGVPVMESVERLKAPRTVTVPLVVRLTVESPVEARLSVDTVGRETLALLRDPRVTVDRLPPETVAVPVRPASVRLEAPPVSDKLEVMRTPDKITLPSGVVD